MLHKNTLEKSTLELLITLQGDDTLKDFSLAGGTSLALQIGHRTSIDLDLFSLSDFDSASMLEHLEHTYDYRLDYSARNTLKGSIQNIKVDLISHRYPLVNPILETEKLKLYSIPDIAAMKLNAIAVNGTRSKDFIDVYFILKKLSLNDILQAYKNKYKNRNLLHVVKSLNYFEDINVQDWPDMILEKDLTLTQVKRSISKHVMRFSEGI